MSISILAGYVRLSEAVEMVAESLHGDQWTGLKAELSGYAAAKAAALAKRATAPPVRLAEALREQVTRDYLQQIAREDRAIKAFDELQRSARAWLRESFFNRRLGNFVQYQAQPLVIHPSAWEDDSRAEFIFETGMADPQGASSKGLYRGPVIVLKHALSAALTAAKGGTNAPHTPHSAVPAFSERWLRVDVFTVDEAVALWIEREPQQFVPMRQSASERSARALIESGLIACQLEPLSPPLLPFAKTGYVPGWIRVSRDALRRFAEVKGERPRFLFPQTGAGASPAIETRSAPTVEGQYVPAGSASAVQRCIRLIEKRAREGYKPNNRKTLFEQAKSEIGEGLSFRCFCDAWRQAAPDDWKSPGRKPRRDSGSKPGQ